MATNKRRNIGVRQPARRRYRELGITVTAWDYGDSLLRHGNDGTGPTRQVFEPHAQSRGGRPPFCASGGAMDFDVCAVDRRGPDHAGRARQRVKDISPDALSAPPIEAVVDPSYKGRSPADNPANVRPSATCA